MPDENQATGFPLNVDEVEVGDPDGDGNLNVSFRVRVTLPTAEVPRLIGRALDMVTGALFKRLTGGR